jgi:hypothetical protein
MGILPAGPAAGRAVDSRISVRQLRHSNVSKCARSPRDLLACMAMPQTGQWRMLGRGGEVNFRSGNSEIDRITSPNTAALELIQINAGANRRGERPRRPAPRAAREMI